MSERFRRSRGRHQETPVSPRRLGRRRRRRRGRRGRAVRDVVLAFGARTRRRCAGRGRHQQGRGGPADHRRMARQGLLGAQPHQGDAGHAAEAGQACSRTRIRACRSSRPTARTSTVRSRRRCWVAIGICTHLGCSPTFRPDVAPADLGPDWLGGFFCPCHQSKFDLAGRVYRGVPAPTNLVIPPYKYLSDAQDRDRHRRRRQRRLNEAHAWTRFSTGSTRASR